MKFLPAIIICIIVFFQSCRNKSTGDNYQEYYGEKQDPVFTDTAFVFFDKSETPDSIVYEVYDNQAIIDGDIVIGSATNDKGLTILGNIQLGKPWPSKTIPYQFEPGFPGHLRKNVEEAIKHWEAKTPLRFTQQNNATAAIVFAEGASATIGSSDVGYQARRQYVKLGTSTGVAVAIHEIGHAIGLFHEQSRPDRDQYVEIVWKNIKRKNQFNFQVKGTPHGPYDFKSRMHYHPTSFSRNGKPTIISRNSANVIANDGWLSEGDIAAVNALYP